jgi:hypothetical protein
MTLLANRALVLLHEWRVAREEAPSDAEGVVTSTFRLFAGYRIGSAFPGIVVACPPNGLPLSAV